MSVAVAVAAMAAGQADAAGLGRLTVQSALGQPLRAEVEITSLSREEAQSLAVKLASPDAFKQAGLEYSSVLSQLRFAVDRRPDGRALVRITSAQPLNEPFVDLLVELNWATGKFVREYTFLLDPPELKLSRDTSVQDSTAPVVMPVAEPSRAQAPAALPPASAPAASSAPAAAGSTSAAPAPAAAPRPAPQRPARAETPRPPVERAAAAAPAPGSVPVQAGETLAGIAARVKPANVTLEQAIIALYRANPGAFFGSVHQLKSGVSLTVPDEAAMNAIDAGAARTEIRAQARDFNAYKARLADAARTVPGTRSGRSASGSVTADIQDRGQGETRGDRLELSKSGDTSAGAGNSVASRGNAGEERRVATEAAVREAQSRVRDLERNVADLQKLVELKNKQLADLQKQVETARTAPAVTGSVGKAEAGKAPGKADTVARVDPPKAEAPKVEPPKAEAPKAEAPKAEAPATMAPPAVTTPPAATIPPAATTPPAAVMPPAEPPKAEAPKPIVPAEAPKADTGFVDELLENPLILPGLGAILLLGAGYGWYAMRRRKKEDKFEDSLINTEGFTANSLFGSTGGQNVDTHASMFTGTRDTTADVHSTEVDPIAEAEVYIAYGRESQAEEILKEALKKQPERQAIRLKLLEIYAGRKDAKAFAAVASEMYGMTGGQNEEWPKVVTLGLAVDPDNPLYTGRAAGDAETFGVNAGAQAEVAADEPPAIIDDAGEEPFGKTADQPFDVPLDMPPRAAADAPQAASAVGAAAAAAGVAAAAAGAAMAFDQKPVESEDKPVTASASTDEVPVLDFDLDIDDEIAKSSAAAATPRASDLSRAVEGRFDLPSLDLTADVAGAAGQARAVSDQALADLEDLKIDMPTVETAEPPVRADEPVAIDLSSIGLDLQPSTMVPPPTADAARWQEMATKLDLASAYEEIGDKEGARELLQEVLKGGDNDQQQKARSMLSKIS